MGNVPDLKHQYIEECWNEVKKEQPTIRKKASSKQKTKNKTADAICIVIIFGTIILCWAIINGAIK